MKNTPKKKTFLQNLRGIPCKVYLLLNITLSSAIATLCILCAQSVGDKGDWNYLVIPFYAACVIAAQYLGHTHWLFVATREFNKRVKVATNTQEK